MEHLLDGEDSKQLKSMIRVRSELQRELDKIQIHKPMHEYIEAGLTFILRAYHERVEEIRAKGTLIEQHPRGGNIYPLTAEEIYTTLQLCEG